MIKFLKKTTPNFVDSFALNAEAASTWHGDKKRLGRTHFHHVERLTRAGWKFVRQLVLCVNLECARDESVPELKRHMESNFANAMSSHWYGCFATNESDKFVRNNE